MFTKRPQFSSQDSSKMQRPDVPCNRLTLSPKPVSVTRHCLKSPTKALLSVGLPGRRRFHSTLGKNSWRAGEASTAAAGAGTTHSSADEITAVKEYPGLILPGLNPSKTPRRATNICDGLKSRARGGLLAPRETADRGAHGADRQRLSSQPAELERPATVKFNGRRAPVMQSKFKGADRHTPPPLEKSCKHSDTEVLLCLLRPCFQFPWCAKVVHPRTVD